MTDATVLVTFLVGGLITACAFGWWASWRERKLRKEVEALRNTESQLRQLEMQVRRRADIAPSTLWEWDVVTGRMHLAERFLELTGYAEDDRTNRMRDLLLLVHPDDRKRLRKIFGDYLEHRAPDCETEFRLRCADGRYLWILTRAVATWNKDGTPERVIGSFTDITSRMDAEEQRVRLFNLSIDMLAVVGFDQYVQQLNPAWVRVLGWSRDDLMGRPLEEFAVEDDRSIISGAFAQLAAGERLEGLECRFVCRDGSSRWLAFTAFPYADRKTVFTVARDITSQKEADSQRALFQERLRQLRNQLSVVEDRQRQELAAAIHDGLAQQLFGLRAQITLLKYPERLSDYEGVVQTAMDVLDQTMIEARSLSFELFPPVLYQMGLEGALQWLTHQYGERTGQACHFSTEGQGEELPQDTRAMLYQCVRELLNNVRKHATAQRVEVVLSWTSEGTEVEVVDDGIGFIVSNPEELEVGALAARGFGLFSIRERVTSVGGSVHIDATPGVGTCVVLRVPAPGGTSPAALD